MFDSSVAWEGKMASYPGVAAKMVTKDLIGRLNGGKVRLERAQIARRRRASHAPIGFHIF